MTNPNGHGGRRPGAGRPKSKTSLLREAAEQLLRRTAALTLIGSCVGWVVVVDGGLAGHIVDGAQINGALPALTG